MLPYAKVKLRSGFGNFLHDQVKVYERVENLVNNLYWRGKTGKLPFERGILCGMKSIQALQKDLQGEGYPYFLTTRVNSDSVENMFSCLRGLGGNNKDPDRIQALQRAKIRMLCSDAEHIVPIRNPSVENTGEDRYVTRNLERSAGRSREIARVDREFLEEQKA